MPVDLSGGRMSTGGKWNVTIISGDNEWRIEMNEWQPMRQVVWRQPVYQSLTRHHSKCCPDLKQSTSWSTFKNLNDLIETEMREILIFVEPRKTLSQCLQQAENGRLKIVKKLQIACGSKESQSDLDFLWPAVALHANTRSSRSFKWSRPFCCGSLTWLYSICKATWPSPRKAQCVMSHFWGGWQKRFFITDRDRQRWEQESDVKMCSLVLWWCNKYSDKAQYHFSFPIS